MVAAMRPLVLYTDWEPTDVGPAVALLRAAGWRVELLGSTDPDAIAAAGAQAAALCVTDARVDAALLARLGSVRVISTMSVGFDRVDVAAATRRGVWVANVPDVATEEVASHAVAMALALVRRLVDFDRDVQAGGWGPALEHPPRVPGELTLGLLGLGRIGRRAGELARGLFGRVVGHDPFADDERWPAGVERLGRDELVAVADVLSLHLPLTQESAGLVGPGLLTRMPPGALLVNVSRGGLVDPVALAAALDAGHLAGAALDVLDTEPPAPGHPLVGHPRVLLTPHVAYLSARAEAAYPLRQAENVLAWQRAGRPRDPVNQVA